MKTIVTFSTVNIGVSIVNTTFLAFILFCYTDWALIGLASGPLLVGTALLVGRLVDAVVNPIVGSTSDNLRSRFGRRKPFIFIGLGPLILLFILIWSPPVALGQTAVIIFLFITIPLFDAIFTFVVVPYYALLPEISTTPEERVRLSMYGNIFAIIGTAIGFMLGPILFDNLGYPTGAIILAIMVFGTVAVALLPTLKERPEFQKIEKITTKDAFKEALKNKPYQIYLVNQMAIQFAFRVLSAGMVYIATSVIGLDFDQSIIVSAGYLVGSLGSFYFWKSWSLKVGKRKAYLYSMVIFSIPLAATWLLLVLHGTGAIIFGIIFAIGAGIGTGGMWIFPPLFVADIVDDEERRIGLRREAVYYGMQEMTEKITISIAIFLEGLILSIFLINTIPDPEHPGSFLNYYNPVGPLLTVGGLGLIAMIIGIISFLKYPKKLGDKQV
ncbi:MAG TPA: MFS transporter [Candidatus Deferrimicrobium sp.]|nr:MFS transporter [Candidatus Deferrimicrobium sp.]